MNQIELIRKHQKEQAAKWSENLKEMQKEDEAFMNSEEYRRQVWESQEERWAKKAKKEGWHYVKKPFIGEAEIQAQADEARKQRIASLKSELRQLLTEEENEELMAGLKASML